MKTVVPDDHPPVFQGSKADTMLRGLADVEIFNTRPRTHDELIQRIGGAEAVISIRGAVAYPREVMEACAELRILSIWGTGTDHVDLPGAKRAGDCGLQYSRRVGHFRGGARAGAYARGGAQAARHKRRG